jgi:hypothetical protein
LVCVGIGVLLVALTAAGFLLFKARSARRLARLLDEIRSQNEPVTAAELDAYYALSPSIHCASYSPRFGSPKLT